MSVSDLKNYLATSGLSYIFDAPMCNFTTLRIGGTADVLVQPRSIEELKSIIALTRKFDVPTVFIGNGSNMLVGDRGIRGACIRLGSEFSASVVNGEEITAQSGITMAQLAQIALKHCLTGFEFASGIPGTIGGGIVMNAGAYKGELKDVVTEATALLPDGTLKVFSVDELDFSYRHSVFTDSRMLVVGVKIRLKSGNRDEIAAQMSDLAARRRKTQPLEYPSAGSAFKRPVGGYAAQMIDECGLKGYSVGDAAVSEKHAGFIINKGHATANDVRMLLADVRKRVYERFDILLEQEIISLGEE